MGENAFESTEAYEEIRRVAERLFRGEKTGHTLQPTALVHEAYLKLAASETETLHFRARITRVMRQILVDHARGKLAAKRGGNNDRKTLDESLHVHPADESGILELEELLHQLQDLDERKATVVELRVFGGYTIEETAEIVGVAESTVSEDWRMARAWLARALEVSD